MKKAEWIQIHTNGASTTFARYYEGQTAEGAPIFVFEKMEVDITAGGHAEIFGREEFDNERAAQLRVTQAVGNAV